ncbi:MAG: tripartite tricarboxylate transporter TctB family protein [Hyphomicrobiaceae bacterium]
MLPSDPSQHVGQQPSSGDWSNTIAGAFFACLGAYVLQEAQNFEDVGATMPIFVGIGLIVLSAILILANYFRSGLIAKVEPSQGSMRQRAILIVLVSVWVLVLPYAGFLLSSIIAFGLIAASVPKAERWTPVSIAGHAIGCISVTMAFWYVLTVFLNVPLPAARFW